MARETLASLRAAAEQLVRERDEARAARDGERTMRLRAEAETEALKRAAAPDSAAGLARDLARAEEGREEANRQRDELEEALDDLMRMLHDVLDLPLVRGAFVRGAGEITVSEYRERIEQLISDKEKAEEERDEANAKIDELEARTGARSAVLALSLAAPAEGGKCRVCGKGITSDGHGHRPSCGYSVERLLDKAGV